MQNLVSVIRFDSMPMPRAYFTPEGFLKDKPILTSCGIFEYTNPDGTVRRELRLPEDVFSPESLRSYRGAPIVITHDAGLIDKDNVAENQIGTILSEGERSGDDVRAEIIIHDTDAMKSAGLKELSLGYNLDLDETPGVWNGQRYDAVQKNIRINHLALVREARAGEQARLNLDGRDQVNVLKGGRSMSKKITKVRHADAVLTDEELAKAVDEYKKRRAAEQKTDADDEEEVFAVEEQGKGEDGGVEAQVEAVKARRDRRDEQGDPKDTEEAMGIIANQDEDLDTLFNIIDTLLAKQDFDAAEEEKEEVAEEEPVAEEPVEEEVILEEEEKEDENSPVSGVDDIEKFNKNVAHDADDEEEEIPEDDLVEEEEFEEEPEDGGEVVEEETDIILPEEEEEEDADDDEAFEDAKEGEELFALKRINTDSIDRIVSQKIALGELGKKVGLKGLAHKSVKDAKKAIILAVRPDMRLDGKTDVYINSAFDMARKEIKARSVKDTAYQKKQMFNKDSADVVKKVDDDSAEAHRNRMIARQSKVSK